MNENLKYNSCFNAHILLFDINNDNNKLKLIIPI